MVNERRIATLPIIFIVVLSHVSFLLNHGNSLTTNYGIRENQGMGNFDLIRQGGERMRRVILNTICC